MDKTQLPSEDKIFIALTQANHSMIHMAIKAVQFRPYTLVTFINVNDIKPSRFRDDQAAHFSLEYKRNWILMPKHTYLLGLTD